MKLVKLGEVNHISRSGFIVVSADPKSLPKVGSEVLTRKMDKIGNVYDIIGPTKSPFVLIKPKKVLKEIFEDLFVVSIHARSGEGKRNRKERSGKRDRKGNRKRRNP